MPYSVSVTLRASMALGSHPGASSATFICRMGVGTVLQMKRNVLYWSPSSRWRSSVESSSEVFGATLEAGEEGVKGLSDSATAVTSWCSLCCARASKGTCRSGAYAVPRISPGSRPRHPVRGIVCRPETTKCSEGSWPSWVVIISTR